MLRIVMILGLHLKVVDGFYYMIYNPPPLRGAPFAQGGLIEQDKA